MALNYDENFYKVLLNKLKEDRAFPEPSVTCIGIGGGGCNIVSKLNRNSSSVKTFCLNTDQISNAKRSDVTPVNIGTDYIRDKRDSGGFVKVAKKAFKDDSPEISLKVLKDTELVVIVTTLGGGTGSGGSVQIVKLLKSERIPFHVFAVRPFEFEDGRKEISDEAIEELKRETNDITFYDNNEFDSIKEINQKIKNDVDRFVQHKLAAFEVIYSDGFGLVLSEILNERQLSIDLDVNIGESGESGLIGIK
jgi:cell division GTPase FtsZ